MKRNETRASHVAPGLYVHVPFCLTKCPYCSFYSTTARGGERRWLDAVGREASYRRDVFDPFDTLYLGGGTPSTLGHEEISRLFTAIREVLNFARDCETTIEVNPDDVTADKLALWRDLGVTRLSLGVQSFDDAALRRLGRRHDAGAARRAVALTRKAGFDNLGIDFIYGGDAGTGRSWKRTLEEALEWAPEHLSCYELTIERADPRGDGRDVKALRAPGERAARRLFLETSSLLRSRGYLHYEVSNFARSASHVSRHNFKYWRRAPYLGLGPSAHSFRDERRWWNVRSLEEYVEALERGREPIAASETLGDEERRLETLSLGFRTTDGVPIPALGNGPGWEETLERLVREGLVTVGGGRVVPTVEGLCVADRLPILFSG